MTDLVSREEALAALETYQSRVEQLIEKLRIENSPLDQALVVRGTGERIGVKTSIALVAALPAIPLDREAIIEAIKNLCYQQMQNVGTDAALARAVFCQDKLLPLIEDGVCDCLHSPSEHSPEGCDNISPIHGFKCECPRTRQSFAALPLDDCGPLCANKDTLRESCNYHSRRVDHFVHAVLDVLGREWCDDEWMSDAEITDELKAKVSGALPVLETKKETK